MTASLPLAYRMSTTPATIRDIPSACTHVNFSPSTNVAIMAEQITPTAPIGVITVASAYLRAARRARASQAPLCRARAAGERDAHPYATRFPTSPSAFSSVPTSHMGSCRERRASNQAQAQPAHPRRPLARQGAATCRMAHTTRYWEGLATW